MSDVSDMSDMSDMSTSFKEARLDGISFVPVD